MPKITHDGVTFHVEDCGSGPPVVLLHGLTGSSQSWTPLAETLVQSHHVVAIDIIGHGASDAPEDAARYAFDRALDDLTGIAAALDIDRALWLGYSMGGRLALALARRRPRLVSALILESASPGVADPVARAERRAADEALSARIEDRGTTAFVDEWERFPLWSSQQRLPAETLREQREIRLQNRAAGLAGSLRGMGAGAQDSLWERLAEIAVPVLLVAGERDEKFAEIARQMHAAMPTAELDVVAGAGHAVHLEQPEYFAERVGRFLAGIEKLSMGSSQEAF